MKVRDVMDALAKMDPEAEVGPTKGRPRGGSDLLYPTVYAMVDREAASAIESLGRYVRPGGDYILTRGMLDEIDRGIGEIEAILSHEWNGYSWSRR